MRSISPVTMAGSVSIGVDGIGGTLGGVAPASSTWTDRMKSARSTMAWSAFPMSGSPLPMTSRRPARVTGDARARVTSTNSRPPASAIGRAAVSCHTESPNGVIGSVIICP